MKNHKTMIEHLQNNDSIIIAGHRGYKAVYPENTLLSFQQALHLGVDMIEFDLRLSKDGEVVVIHDETVDRTTNGTGHVCELTLAELKQLDAGSWFGAAFEGLKIPTLNELCILLQAYPHVLLNVEIKSSIHAKTVVDQAVTLLTKYGYMDRAVFTCFDAQILAYLHDPYHVKTQGFQAEVMSNFDEGANGTYDKMWAIGIEMSLLSRETVQHFKQMGLETWCYCPDDTQQVLYALGCGVTVMTVNAILPAMQVRQQLHGLFKPHQW